MSSELVGLVIKSNLKKIRLAVMTCLADYADENDCAWPSQIVIEERTGFKPRAIINAIAGLEKDEYLKVARGKNKVNNQRLNNVYFLNKIKLRKEADECNERIRLRKIKEKFKGKESDLVINPFTNQPVDIKLTNHVPWSSTVDLCDIPCAPNAHGPCAPNAHGPCAPNAQDLSNGSYRSESKTIVELDKKTDTIKEVYEYWKETCKHPKASNEGPAYNERKQAIEKGLRLTNGNVAKLKKAVLGCSKTPHNMGMNDNGEKYDELHIIFKSAVQIERFCKNADNPPKPKANHTGSSAYTNINDQKKQAAEIAEDRERKLFDRAFKKGGSDVKNIE